MWGSLALIPGSGALTSRSPLEENVRRKALEGPPFPALPALVTLRGGISACCGWEALESQASTSPSPLPLPLGRARTVSVNSTRTNL